MNLMIIAAGNGSRMGNIPKCLSKIGDKSNLLNTVIQSEKAGYRKCYIVTKEEFLELYANELEGWEWFVEFVTIQSGRGCGHAVLEALKIIPSQDLVFCWSDVYFKDEKLLLELKDKPLDCSCLIPVVFEDDPYAWLAIKADNFIRAVNFKKRGEIINRGLHDQSIFKINSTEILSSLSFCHRVLDKGGFYMNKEMIFLDVCHFLWNNNSPAKFYITEFPTSGFNTIEELNFINNSLKNSKLDKDE